MTSKYPIVSIQWDELGRWNISKKEVKKNFQNLKITYYKAETKRSEEEKLA